MKEFMLLIKAKGNPIGSFPAEKQKAHIEKVGGFIQGLAQRGLLKNAQPFIPSGVVLSNKKGSFSNEPINENEEMIVGFYHIEATDLNEALSIAQKDPRFEDGVWKMEVREIMKVAGIN
jgi:hypothetical protein